MLSSAAVKPVTPSVFAEGQSFTPLASSCQRRWQEALENKRAVKLIAGGSLTDAETVAQCAVIYAHAGVPCVDVAPDRGVVQAVVDRWSASGLLQADWPLLMVSLPLDPDPHFRKIELTEAACVSCDACTPVCPTEALAVPTTAEQRTHSDSLPLLIDQPLCYGCGRCVPVCPTEALTLLPNSSDYAGYLAALNHPSVEAVEIHTKYADVALLPAFMETFESVLVGKAIALCFQPSPLPAEQWLAFVDWWQQWCEQYSPVPLTLQIDGHPMGGTSAKDAPVAAITEAWEAWQRLKNAEIHFSGFITLSGGMNQHTGHQLMRYPAKAIVSGMGVGTMARKQIWPWLHNHDQQEQPCLVGAPPSEGVLAANELVASFTL